MICLCDSKRLPKTDDLCKTVDILGVSNVFDTLLRAITGMKTSKNRRREILQSTATTTRLRQFSS